MGGGIHVGASYIRHQDPACLPWHDSGYVWSFPIQTADAGWFQVRWHPADVSDLLTISLMAAWRGCLPWLLRQLSPWMVHLSLAMLAHVGGTVWSLGGGPWPMATRTTSLSMRKPNDDTGRACSHAPDSFVTAASRWAHAGASGADSRRFLYGNDKRGASQDL